MSRVYDNWEKLVGAVVKREELRRLAYCESLSSSSISADFSSRFSFNSTLEDVPAGSTNSGQTFDPADPSSQSIFSSRNTMVIEYKEIKKATKNFRPDMSLGQGGFGGVYKGWINKHTLTASNPESGIPVAVKKLNTPGLPGHRQWVSEINYLSELHHPNLIKPIGYCIKDDERILVYEFMTKGSLANHLFTSRNNMISWASRIKVAIGVARGLSFLHDLAIPVIHRGFNTSNILLDREFNAKLSDFGLARDGPTGDMTHVTTRIVGVSGSIAPEYMLTGHLTTKCDIYSFGVVLLEILSGIPTYDTKRLVEGRNLVDWARRYLGDKQKLLLIMDSKLGGQYPHNTAYEVAKLASNCLSLDPNWRPRMDEIVVALQQL